MRGLKYDKKLSCCRDSSRYDKVTDSGRQAKSNLNCEYDLCEYYFTNEVVTIRYPTTLCQLASTLIFTKTDLVNNSSPIIMADLYMYLCRVVVVVVVVYLYSASRSASNALIVP